MLRNSIILILFFLLIPKAQAAPGNPCDDLDYECHFRLIVLNTLDDSEKEAKEDEFNFIKRAIKYGKVNPIQRGHSRKALAEFYESRTGTRVTAISPQPIKHEFKHWVEFRVENEGFEP